MSPINLFPPSYENLSFEGQSHRHDRERAADPERLPRHRRPEDAARRRRRRRRGQESTGRQLRPAGASPQHRHASRPLRGGPDHGRQEAEAQQESSGSASGLKFSIYSSPTIFSS